jgi:SF-assemblin/beta giardin
MYSLLPPSSKKSSVPALPQLASLQEDFANFERTQFNGQSEAEKSSSTDFLAVTVSTLEKTLAAEIRRRVETTKHLQQLFADQIKSVKEKLESIFADKLTLIDDAKQNLNSRIAALERDFTFQREKYLQEIDSRQKEVKEDLISIESVLKREIDLRSQKDTMIMERVVSAEQKIQAVMTKEKQLVDSKLQLLRDSLIEYKKIRDRGDEKFQSFVVEEIATLKNALIVETQSREQADDDIVQALNHYTKALQEALKIVN